ncbi:Hsp70 family protein [Plebeiibacterium marinum]|uniref:Hsp70 family protein n=1 Tax=Plebeiibacterium marinum TaxID=2992111 RepID=A0AAE3MD47_9BACT|nr:Hsp70 family protein [Plebeiobacterium marinum]MCW3805676.1 Hsp70 family protein [Plebeiobacterium marinum]
MARTKIDYGIDLGTTNSAISRMEHGEPVIKKTDTLKDTMPSCVYVNKKKAIQVGDSAYNAMKRDKLKAMKSFDSDASNSFIEFKRTMGTDKKYNSTNMGKEFSSEELSAEVLKTLRSFVSDETFKSIVITVPAKFTINQKDATVRASKLAGFEHCELLQEPIAASMAYGLDSKSKDGYWLVFDFGGGTFDAALLKVEEGIMKVIDTEGDNYLGGKNLDFAIVDEIIIPHLQENFAIDSIIEDEKKKHVLQETVKAFAEETKIQMSFNDTFNILSDLGDIPGEDDEGEEFELDITVTQEMMQNTLGPIFQKSIDICKDLLKRNSLSGSDLDSLILVGGPTYSPVLRKMLEEQICKPDVSVDPMTVVSKGAALYASTIDVSDEIKEQQRDKTKIQLEFGYEATTVEEEEFVTVKILKDKTEGEIPSKVFVDVVRADKAWSSGKTEIDEAGDVIEVKLNSGKPNAFDVLTYNEQGDLLPSEPSSFTIIQGSKVGSATLPYNIGIEIKSRASGKVVFRSIKGLEKNQSTPATGTINGLKTQKQIRPGIAEDSIKIPIYQGEHGAENTRAIYNEHVYDVIISGNDLPSLLPEGSDVDLTVKVDKSEGISLSAFFPTLDYSHDIEVPSNTTQEEIDAGWLDVEINKAKQTLSLIQQEGIYSDEETLAKLNSEISETQKRFEQGKGDYDRKKDVLDSLRRSLKKLDEIQASSEWPKTEEELKDVFYRLEETNERFGNEKTTAVLHQFKEQIPEIIKEKNVKVAQEMIDNMRSLDFALVDQGLGAQMEIIYLKNFNDEFDTLHWKDRNRARMTLDRGLQMAANNPTKEKLRPVIIELFNLLPETDKPMIGGGDGSELIG